MKQEKMKVRRWWILLVLLLGSVHGFAQGAVGIHYQRMRADSKAFTKEQADAATQSKLRGVYVLTPFGWEIGKQKVRWFAEFGVGSNANFLMGLTYRFGRY